MKTYIAALVLELVASLFVRWLPAGGVRAFFCSAIGFATVCMLCAEQTGLYLIVAATTFAIFRLSTTVAAKSVYSAMAKFSDLVGKGAAGFPVLVCTLVVVTAMRLCPWWELRDETNTCFLIFVLRSISFAFEGVDFSEGNLHISSETENSDFSSTASSSRNVSPKPTAAIQSSFRVVKVVSENGIVKSPWCPFDFSFLHYFHYILFFPGIFCSPWLTPIETHRACCNTRTKEVRGVIFAFRRLAESSVHIALLGFLVYSSADTYVFTDSYLEHSSLLHRLTHGLAFFIWKRSRLLACFAFSEVACVFAGIGFTEFEEKSRAHSAVEKLPRDTQLTSLSRASNVDQNVFRCFYTLSFETAHSLSDMTRKWNCSCQRWLVIYIYRRLPRRVGTLRKMAVVIVSVVWHGFNKCLFVSGAIFLVCLVAEDPVLNSQAWARIRAWALAPSRFAFAQKFGVALVHTALAHCLMMFTIIPFCCPDLFTTWRFMCATAFCGCHIFLPALFFFRFFVYLTGKRKTM